MVCGVIEFSIAVRIRPGLGHKFANCACRISKLRSAFCKLCTFDKSHAAVIMSVSNI